MRSNVVALPVAIAIAASQWSFAHAAIDTIQLAPPSLTTMSDNNGATFALAATQPGDSTLIVLPDSTNWRAIPLLDARTSRRTIDSAEAIVPLVVETDSASLYTHARPSGVYLALPNGPAQRGLEQVAASFVIGPERRFTRGPYQLSAYQLTPRAR